MALEEAKHHSQLVARLEEEAMLELRSGLAELQDEVRSKVEDLEETMHKLEREYQEAKSVFNRMGSKRKHDVEEELFEKWRNCEQKLRRSEKELKDLDRFFEQQHGQETPFRRSRLEGHAPMHLL
uniref:Protein Muted homolog n=1 Tax=Haemonchus contortus TaxID=6289 RepID=A0A7I5E952_HAECO